ALHAIKFLAAGRYVRRLALMGTPTDGTWIGLAGVATVGMLSQSVWQVLPTSSFLRDIRDAPLPPGLRVRQLHAAEDALCPLPRPLPDVDRKEDFVVLPGGHSSLVVSKSFYSRLREFFDEQEAGRDTTTDVSEAAAE